MGADRRPVSNPVGRVRNRTKRTLEGGAGEVITLFLVLVEPVQPTTETERHSWANCRSCIARKHKDGQGTLFNVDFDLAITGHEFCSNVISHSIKKTGTRLLGCNNNNSRVEQDAEIRIVQVHRR